MDNKKLNKIPDRIDRIDNMLKGKSMDSIIDSDDKIFKKNDYEDYESSEDIRNLVPKKYIDFSKNELEIFKSGSTGHTFKEYIHHQIN